MAKTNWGLGDTVRPADMNEIGTEINQLREDVDNIEIPPASLTVPGIVSLSNKTDGTSEEIAPTEKAVSDARLAAIGAAAIDATAKVTTHNNLTIGIHGAVSTATANRLVVRDANGRAKFAAPNATDDVALLSTVTGQVGTLSNLQTIAKGNAVAAINEVFQSGVSAKQGVVDAINAKGGSASTSDTWAQLVTKINAIEQGRYKRERIDSLNEQINATSAGINVMRVLKSYEAGTKIIVLTPYPSGSAYLSINSQNGSISGYLALRDSAGRIWQISKASNNDSISFSNSIIDVNSVSSGGISLTASTTGSFVSAYVGSVWQLTNGQPKPSGFDIAGPLDLVVVGQVLTSSPTGLWLQFRTTNFESISR